MSRWIANEVLKDVPLDNAEASGVSWSVAGG